MKVRIISKMRYDMSVDMDVQSVKDITGVFEDRMLWDISEAFEAYLNTNSPVEIYGLPYEVSDALHSVDSVRYNEEFQYFLEDTAKDIFDYIEDECEYDGKYFWVHFLED